MLMLIVLIKTKATANHILDIFSCLEVQINWQCRKQLTVALSTTETEYVALAEAAKKAYKKFLLGYLISK